MMRSPKPRPMTMKETTTIIHSEKKGRNQKPRSRILIGTPTLGVVRMEWSIARFGQVIPCNWSSASTHVGLGNIVPINHLVADAQNLIVKHCLEQNFEWLLLWEDDVVAPPETFLKMNAYMMKCDIPVVSGLYFTKGNYSEPILYKGRGNSYCHDFKIGDKIWVDGVPTGLLLIHTSLLTVMWNESEEYTTLGNLRTRKVFQTPSRVFYDPQSSTPVASGGTSDLDWCNRVINDDVLKRAGWPKIARKKHPFLCDTTIFCKHIDLNTGKQYPTEMPEEWVDQLHKETEKKVRESVIEQQKNSKAQFAGV